ncbi:MAG: PSD1 and planctomycete cytochrome C domain-containing protein [Sediminibacterium sp.]
MTVLVAGITLVVFNSYHATVDFNAEVKPILNKKCITCHGGVKRQADFSLLFRSEALAKTKSGKPAIIPGDPEHSEMIRRIRLKDPEDRMPYHHEPLNDKEIKILSRWIKQGAKWGDHWAYLPVQKVAVPGTAPSFFGLIPAGKNNWARNDIDYFVYDKLQQQKLKPAAEADRATLLRRVCLDLTGLPPSEILARQFLHDGRGNAYELLVDALLASPHFGERWTAVWLDLARYADTKGYERDAGRSIWRYRDWLIKAFNSDKPYDQFLIEQLAGDLLPHATDEQFIATAFNRNTMTNDEGGTDNEEFRTAAVIDRVNTTWQSLMGTTFSCVQCHSHPYDPFTHDEYYKFMAFFNDTRDEDTEADYPLLRHYDSTDNLKLALLSDWLKKNGFSEKERTVYQFLKTWQPAINSIQADQFVNCELNDTKWLALRNHATARLKGVDLDQKDQLVYRYAGAVPHGMLTIHLDQPNGPVLKTISVPQTKGWMISSIDFAKQGGVHDLFFSYTSQYLKKPEDNGMKFDWFYFTQSFPGKDKQGYDSAKKIYWQLLTRNVPTTLVMMDNPRDMHRATNVFERGNWLVKGKQVEPDVPHALNPLKKDAPRNRLGMAMWLTDKNNPLTARTMVNRLWEQLFGTGLVETLEDMGTQGAEPANKELLDFLSYQFMYDFRFSIKKLLKEMVMSASYRQDSKLTRELQEKDPYNRFLSRGARVRLSAEQIRDQALAVSGLLSDKMYGPSVKPWQPEGIWMSPWNGEYWKKSEGEDQYRRALYTFWKRTAPYPSMITFDGTGREVCTSRRIRTNTPLQALVTLNDSVYLELSRQYAYRIQNLSQQKDIRALISKGYEAIMFKPVAPEKLNVLVKLYHDAYSKFKNDQGKTREMTGLNDRHNNPETAALVVVTGVLLNLDEVITKN